MPKKCRNSVEKELTLILVVITPTTTQHNLNTVVGLDMKMVVQTPPPPPPTHHHHNNNNNNNNSNLYS